MTRLLQHSDIRLVIESRLVRTLMAACAMALLAPAALGRPTAQTAAITYQGVLKQDGSPVNTPVDLQFRLFDSASAGTQIGLTLAAAPVTVSNGLFTASLDFGAASFNGEERWLEIAVSAPNNGNGPFTILAPRQKLASTPYAAFALQSAISGTYDSSVNFSNAGNQFAGSFLGSGAGLTNINPANLAAGTAGISISGNAATATSATTAASAANVTGIVAVANGGTGANSAANARANLGAAAAAHTHPAADIASGNLDVMRMPTGGAWSLSSNLNLNANALVIEQATSEVGIGTATPTANLEVVRNLPNNLNPIATLRQAGANSTAALRFQNSASNHFNLGVTPGNEFALNYNNNVSLASDLLRISPSGQVGIGSTPESRLHVNMSDTGNAVVLFGAPLMLESMADNWISMVTDAADLSGVAFGRPGSTLPDLLHGAVVYNDALANGMEFRTGGNLTRMAIDSAGSVGVATSTPAAALNVYEPDESATLNNFTQAVSNAGVLISTDYTDGAYTPGIFWNTLNDNPAKPKAGIFLHTDANGSTMHLRASTNYTTGLDSSGVSIDSSSHVGIGVSAPQAALEVTGGSFSTHVLDVHGSDGADVHIAGGNRAGGLNAGDVHIEGGQGFTLTHGGDVILDGGDSDNNGAGDVILRAGDSTQVVGGDIVITAGVGPTSNSNGEVLITGRVGIGRDPGNTNAFEVEGNAAKTAAGSWLANSDRRIKTDIETVSSALDTLDQVRLTWFRYTPAYLRAHPSMEDRRYLNVIAQEFASVFPDHVKGSGEFLSTGEEILQVDTHPLTIYSAAAIQELHDLSIKQKEDIERLTRAQATLREDTDSLKQELDVRDLTIADLLKRLETLEKQAKEAKPPQPE